MGMSFAAQRPQLALAANTALLPASTNDGVQFGMVFDNLVADKSVLVGTRNIMWGSTTTAAAYPGLWTTGYITSIRDQDAAHDDAWYLANLPDELMYEADQATLVSEFSNNRTEVQFNNPRFWNYQVAYAQTHVAAGYDGIAFDNVTIENVGARVGHFESAVWVADYTGSATDAKYIQDTLGLMNVLHQRLNALGIPVMANVSPYISAIGDAKKLARLCDIALVEHAFYDQATTSRLNSSWILLYEFHTEAAANGGFFAVCQFPSNTLATATETERAWMLSNFLLVKGPYSWLHAGNVSEYGAFLDYAAADMTPDVGTPSAAASRVGDVWVRDFTNGFVAVNPWSGKSVDYTVPAGTWLDQFGNSVSAGLNTLGAATGIVLVKQ